MQEDFVDDEAFARVFFHEGTHWAEQTQGWFIPFKTWGDENYAKGELVAEIGSFLWAAHLGYSSQLDERSAAYIRSWLKALPVDKRNHAILKAAQAATKAFDFLRGDYETQ